jgi:hypothetical protein
LVVQALQAWNRERLLPISSPYASYDPSAAIRLRIRNAGAASAQPTYDVEVDFNSCGAGNGNHLRLRRACGEYDGWLSAFMDFDNLPEAVEGAGRTGSPCDSLRT